jgi:limonene-1,2-epoxide hydrolase
VTNTTIEIDVVQDFLSALERLDVDAAVAKLDDDVVYQNVPFPAARGRQAVEQQLRWFARHSRGFEVRWHNVAANGDVVLTERTDAITVGSVSADFWVCGTFELRDGRIVLWRDRFDLVNVVVAFVRGALAAGWRRYNETRTGSRPA